MVPTAFARGPSPRGWGIRGTAAQPCRLPRTIPTRVGNTATGILGFLLSADHPHAGGEYHRMLSPELRGTGPSPRGWGIPQQRGIHDMPDRTIPTRVGNTRPAWGWSGRACRVCPVVGVFPTRVGMVRFRAAQAKAYDGIPHPRGDGPQKAEIPICRWRYSPPAWGWSGAVEKSAVWRGVFPTRVGMVRGSRQGCAAVPRIPHPRGDGPRAKAVGTINQTYSPPAWGWSVRHQPGHHARPVFPTRVGMVRNHRSEERRVGKECR